MFESILQKIGVAIVSVGLFLGSLFGVPSDRLGATIPVVPALFETSLASSITSSDTSMSLVSGVDKSGDSLSGYMCFSIDDQTSSQEFVCGTVAGTAVTSMSRGIDPIDGDLEVTALKKAHRRGASVKVTDYPVTGILARIMNGNETFPNILKYSTSTLTFTDNASIITKKYADDLSYAGVADASETSKGISELATQAEMAIGTATGTSGAYLVPQNKWLTQTPGTATTVPVANASGKLAQGWIDLSDSFTFESTTTFSATSTFNGGLVGVPGRLRSVQVYTASSTWTKPANVTLILVKAVGGGGGGAGAGAADTGQGGGGGGYTEEWIDVSATSSVPVVVGLGGIGGAADTDGQTASSSSFGSYLTAGGGVKGVSSGTMSSNAGTATGGDLNIPGQSGSPVGGAFASTNPTDGGNSMFGFGGRTPGGDADGVSATGYGGGGSGGHRTTGSGSQNGGTGTNGLVVVYEYY